MSKPMLYVDTLARPVVRRSLCAFLDVLGFRQSIKDAEGAPGGTQALLERYLAAVSPPTSELLDTAAVVRAWQVLAFSDSVVLGYPVWTEDSEVEFGGLQQELSLYQLSLAVAGLFVRGAVTVGELFVNDSLAFGPAMVEAYELQDREAVNPRVIFSPAVVSLLRDHLGFYSHAWEAPHNRVLLVDSDGHVFLNYLEATLQDEHIDGDTLARHRAVVESGLQRHAGTPRVWSKYAWLADYHNFFISLLGSHVDARSLCIPISATTHHFTRFAPCPAGV